MIWRAHLCGLSAQYMDTCTGLYSTHVPIFVYVFYNPFNESICVWVEGSEEDSWRETLERIWTVVNLSW